MLFLSFPTTMISHRSAHLWTLTMWQALQNDFWDMPYGMTFGKEDIGGLAPFFLADGHISGLRSS